MNGFLKICDRLAQLGLVQQNLKLCFLHWIKIDTQLENCILYTTLEDQWEINSTLKVDQLLTPLLRKRPLNVLVHQWESSCLSSPIQHGSHPLKPASPISTEIHM
jgi:hypothetical protein